MFKLASLFIKTVWKPAKPLPIKNAILKSHLQSIFQQELYLKAIIQKLSREVFQTEIKWIPKSLNIFFRSISNTAEFESFRSFIALRCKQTS